MHNLIDFVNHGVFPFAGRHAVLRQLTAFREQGVHAHELRVLLLSGEAGMGKSRLLEEFVGQETADRAIVLTTKFFANSTTVFTSMLAGSLWSAEEARKLLLEKPENTLPSVIAGIRRLSRLRPVLLVAEDLHNLNGDLLPDFASVLNSLAEEPVSVICSVRPGDYPARSVLARFLVDEVALPGLDSTELTEVWKGFFQADPDPVLIELLLEHTLGNPMALRTALRNALRSGTISRNELSGEWTLSVSVETFTQQLSEDVRLLSGGMVAHLNATETALAVRLSMLGEMFSREAADLVAGEDRTGIDALIFKGIIVRLGMGTESLCGSTHPVSSLGFTHSLIHDFLLQENDGSPDELLHVLAEDIPVCSVVPYRILIEHCDRIGTSRDILAKAIRVILERALALELTADWRSGVLMVQAAEAVLHTSGDGGEDIAVLRLRVAAAGLRLLRRENHTTEYAGRVQSFDDATREVPELHAVFRLIAFTYMYAQLRRKEHGHGFRAMWERIQSFLSSHPFLKHTREYAELLQVVGRNTNDQEDMAMIGQVDEALQELLNDPDLPDELEDFVLRNVAPLVLWKFGSSEELQDRIRLLERLQLVGGDSLWVLTRALAFYDGIGEPRKVLEIAERLIPVLRAKDLQRDLAQVRLFRLYSLALFGASLSRIESEAGDILAVAPEEIRIPLARSMAARMSALALLRGETEWAARMVAGYEAESRLLASEHLLYAFHAGDTKERVRQVLDNPALEVRFALGLRLLTGENVPLDDVAAELVAMLEAPVYTRAQVLERFAAAELVEILDNDALKKRLGKLFMESGRQLMAWLLERGLGLVATYFLERYAQFSGKEQREWRVRITDADPGINLAGYGAERESLVEISMIGDITVKVPGESAMRVRGGRLRTLLGLLVADQLLPSRLSYREFCSIASGGEEDPERARKMSSMGLLRLREAFGEDWLVTGDGSPELNVARVRVDLLDAVALLREAADELRRGSLMRSHLVLCEGLDCLNGEVPFPTLYDNFFEASRNDVDHLVRNIVLNVVGALRQENDLQVAEQVLKRAVRVLRNDEELMEMLEDVLRSRGLQTEAERLKLRREVLEQDE